MYDLNIECCTLSESQISMRRLLLFLLALSVYSTIQAQELPDFASIPLKEEKDFNKTANDAALEAAAYALSTPFTRPDPKRKAAAKYIMDWMEGTPDYGFELDNGIVKLTNQNPDLFLLVMAGMTEFALTNDEADSKRMQLYAVRKLVRYVQRPDYGIKPEGELKNAIAAEKASRLDEYMKKLSAY